MIKQIFFSITIFLLMPFSIFAAQEIDLKNYFLPSHVWEKPLRSEQDLGSILKIEKPESLKTLRVERDSNSFQFFRFRQTYQGVPVFARQVILTLDGDNKIFRLSGTLIRGLNKDLASVEPNLRPEEAISKALKQHNLKGVLKEAWVIDREEANLVIYLDEKSQAHLAYVVTYFADTRGGGNPTRPYYILSAQDGRFLREPWEGLTHVNAYGPGGNLKTGQYFYGEDEPALSVYQFLSFCFMLNQGVGTYNLNHAEEGDEIHMFVCPTNTHKNINGAYSPLNDAHFFGKVVSQFYGDWLPFQISSKVHYSHQYEGAFWNGQSAYFGDGDFYFYPLVSLDVVAHEFSHGITQHYSDLIYENQSGGINESFSDIAGEAVEAYLGEADFMSGYDIFKFPNQALRYLFNPPADGASIDHVSDYYDGMDVHYSSGIFNKAYYLLAQKPGWDALSAFTPFFKANRVYWTETTNFQKGACDVFQAQRTVNFDKAVDVAEVFVEVGLSCCGDGIVSGDEECDDANNHWNDACVFCKLAYCGDGIIQTGVEECDDGNDNPNDGCDNCHLPPNPNCGPMNFPLCTCDSVCQCILACQAFNEQSDGLPVDCTYQCSP